MSSSGPSFGKIYQIMTIIAHLWPTFRVNSSMCPHVVLCFSAHSQRLNRLITYFSRHLGEFSKPRKASFAGFSDASQSFTISNTTTVV